MSHVHQSKDVMGKLILADGQEIEGISFGAKKSMSGEVVFNTGMVGYPEALTDPSYTGQILILTSPMIGNYGVPSVDAKDEYGISKFFEGNCIHIAGLIVTDYSVEYSHWNASKSLSQWLNDNGIPALYGIDTRKLTKFIRECGAILGKIEFPGDEITFGDPNKRHLVQEVSTKEIQIYCNEQSPRIIAYDCGMKLNITRYFIHELKVCLIVVPFDYDLEVNPSNLQYDGIFISNGPGDPTMCKETIESIRWAIKQPNPKPLFGICLGNQLLALACGAKTYKMKYGNRGMNQPCIDLRTTKCFITSQNHGYAVDNHSLPHEWKPLFLNANDLSNEGIIHTFKPFFSCQFHPEAAGGPLDTTFLFHDFLDLVKGNASERVLISPSLYDRSTIRKVLLIGSGGLSIGQAGEFDYSGSQAIKALKEEGLEVILINPNIATVQTSKGLGRPSADRVYFLPIKANVIEEIIIKERPDGVLVSMGGQTALNVGVELWRAGIFQKYNCKVLGTPIDTIIATEDREIFAQKLHSINERLAISFSATNIAESKAMAAKIGYPVLVRAAFALGGLGSGFAENESQLEELAIKAFAVSDQILIDQDLRGWKEIEYEVVRDNRDNCITVCNMENFDPLGVHTGDSIVIAPSQTLSNSEYFKLRAVSLKVIRSLGIIGECNIQYALNPHSEEYCIVEVNARLSRSSALASKATGYPLAYVAAKLCLGKDLVSIKNSINKTTTACFEPSLDYCVVKVPRWDLSKFNKVSAKLGSSMLSVGEVMSIGKTFEEAIQKAVRMVSGGVLEGLEGALQEGKQLEEMLHVPTDKRLFAVQYALEKGMSIDEIHSLSKIDRWFLSRLKKIADLKVETKAIGSIEKIPRSFFRTLKIAGFSDRQIAKYCGSTEQSVRKKRLYHNIFPYSKQIDTLAAEFPAQTNYLYMTYNGSEHDVMSSSEEGALSLRTHEIIQAGKLPISPFVSEKVSRDLIKEEDHDNGGIMVLGCGAYCIGSSVEFDWCAVSAVRQLRSMGDKVIVVNYNPETVSTDYDESDKLYFEELTFERVLDIYELEKSVGIMVSVGGQIPNNLALPLHQVGVRILGTSPDSIDKAEDRHKFSALLDKLKVRVFVCVKFCSCLLSCLCFLD
jgi:carbamoyl-phosphate synthase small subunit